MRIVAVVRRELRLNDNPLFQDANRHEIIPLIETARRQIWRAKAA